MKVWTVSTTDDNGTNTQLFTDLAQAERVCAEWVRAAWFLDDEPMPQDWRAAYQMMADRPGMVDTLCLSEHDTDAAAKGSDGKALMFPDEIEEEDEDRPAKFRISIAMDIRAYGAVEIEAETLEEAMEKLTADYVAEHFEPNGGGDDDYDWSTPRCISATGWDSLTKAGDDIDAGDLDHEVPPGSWEK